MVREQVQPFQPLRIQKGTSGNSPAKMSATNRPLAEVSPMAIRRNSPSFPQGNKASMFKSGDSSPFEASPFNNNQNASSPRLFWQGRDPSSPARGSLDNRSPFSNASPSPAKRGSIENLKKASRVKNSSIFSLEEKFQYDPAKPTILDGRPSKAQESPRKENVAPTAIYNVESKTTQFEVTAMTTLHSQVTVPPLSPSKNNSSPTKSSLSKKVGASNNRSGFDPETGIWSDSEDLTKKLPEGRVLHRRGKSVTFDQAPPQVNEYEMTTPDPSVASSVRESSYDSTEDDEEVSFERGSSFDREDSFDASLEDTDKTPVVLPEDWRFMTPETANTELCDPEDDVFEDDYGSPAPTAQPNASAYRPQQSSVTSIDSNGQARPLPPLPPMPASSSAHRDSLSGTIERISSSQRTLPSPPQASHISKNDIRRMSGSNFSLEDRLQLMMLNDSEQKSEAEKQRERRMRRAGSKETSPVRAAAHHSRQLSIDEGLPGPALLIETAAAPPISRQSILRSLRSEQDLNERYTTEDASHLASSPPRPTPLDPDIPIPSVEDPTQSRSTYSEAAGVVIKEEEVDDNDLYSIPDLYSQQAQEEDMESEYSQVSVAPSTEPHAEGADTPRAASPAPEPMKKSLTHERMSLPDFMDFGESSSFLDLGTYMTPPSEQGREELEKALPQLPKEEVKKEEFQTSEPTNLYALPLRPQTPELQPPSFLTQDEPSTPESVIRHHIERSPLPEVPEAEATIKAPGSGMKARPSFNPAEAEEMAFTRRQVSATIAPPIERPSLATAEPQDSYVTASEVPADGESSRVKRKSSLVQLEIPRDQSDEGLGFGLEKEFDRVVEAQKVKFDLFLQRLHNPFNTGTFSAELPGSDITATPSLNKPLPPCPKPRGARALPGDRPARGHVYPTDGSHFANRSPGRQRGYLMRQNTKVVVASERNTSEETKEDVASSSNTEPSTGLEVQASAAAYRKISQPTWTAEPWNPKSRRRSIRTAGEDSPKKKRAADGPAPPLPGQVSNVQQDLGAVAEDEIAEEEAEDFEDGAERGRLFVKVVGVKDLDLPLPKREHAYIPKQNEKLISTDERTSFALTLDNGLHCVTTAWLDLDRSAPIGQEFELVVLNELEFQLTLQMKLEAPIVERPVSPTKAPSSPVKKQGAFGRFFGSPKKRKESELRAQQEANAERNRPVTPPSAYEMVQGLVAKDGSFARAYVALSEHEKQSFGRPYSVEVVCFNEWAMEEVNVGSSRSKKATQLQRRPPYPIGKLELQLLYIPKPKNAKDEEMPKSMNSAVRELRDAEARLKEAPKEFEGHLSQQGGDCPYWRRRFFKLVGTKLTAYHETTLQPRATINLAKAVKLIDDKSQLMQKEISTKGGGRRKSAFAEEEDGYMYLEEGFRIRFANGEVIDFYADSTNTKDEWMKALTQVIGKAAAGSSAPIKGWTEMVLKREKTIRKQAGAASPTKTRKEVSPSAPTPTAMPPSMPKPVEQASKGLGTQQQGIPPRSSIPTPSSRSPTRPFHSRTESHPTPSGSRSTANSPVKSRMTREERHKKTRSMIM